MRRMEPVQADALVDALEPLSEPPLRPFEVVAGPLLDGLLGDDGRRFGDIDEAARSVDRGSEPIPAALDRLAERDTAAQLGKVLVLFLHLGDQIPDRADQSG